MSNPVAKLRLALGVLLLAGCATAPPPSKEKEPELPQIVRPVVVVERAQTELVAVHDLLKAGNYRQAEANLEEIIKVRPDIPEAHFNLGWARQKLDRHADAVKAFEAGLKLRVDDVEATNLLGVSLRETGRFAEAEAVYLRGLALAPNMDRLHLNLGILYELYLKRPAQALESYRRYQALQKVPDAKVAGWIALLEKREARP
jgi:tetratricopeptide (TPR) repeat protein